MPQKIQGTIVGPDNPAAAVQVNDPDPVVVEHVRERRPQCIRSGQNLPNTHELADVGQEMSDHLQLIGPPAGRVDRVSEYGDDVRPGRALQSDVQTVLPIGTSQILIKCGGSPQLLFRIDVDHPHQLAVRQASDPRHPFVPVVVVLQVVAFQLLPALALVVEPQVKHAQPVFAALVALPDHQRISPAAADLLDQGRGCGPVGIVQRGLMDGRHDPGEGFLFAHAGLSPWDLCGLCRSGLSQGREHNRLHQTATHHFDGACSGRTIPLDES